MVLPDPVDFPASREVLVPSGKKSRAAANLAALTVLDTLDREDRYATAAEQAVLAQWSGWGAIPEVFDPRNDEFAPQRRELESLITSTEWNQSRHTILTAHYTDPAVVAEVWALMVRAGFTGGPVLEPGSGSGTFIGHAPKGTQMVGVELDTVSARLSAALYPSAQIRNESFAATAVPDQSFAATVGNVPFGDLTLWDDTHNRGRHSIHNHFILKSLHLTAPGGYVAVVTSRYTADSGRSTARKEMAARADLVGAARLPSGAFRRVAGTEVVTDLLVFRVREHDREPSALTRQFLGTSPVTVPATDQAVTVTVNDYFLNHPDHVLGTLSARHGLYGREDLTVLPTEGRPVAEQLAAVMGPVIDTAVAQGQGCSPQLVSAPPLGSERGVVTPGEQRADIASGTLRYNNATDRIDVFDGTSWAESSCPKSRTREWRALLEMRDIYQELIATQREGGTEQRRTELRAELNTHYDQYVTQYGFINRFTWVEPKAVTDAQHATALNTAAEKWLTTDGAQLGIETRDDIPAEVLSQLSEQAWQPTRSRSKRAPHLAGALRRDPYFQLICSLESFDEDRMVGTKSAVFRTDVLKPSSPVTHAESIDDALAVSMNDTGIVDVSMIAALLDTDTAQVEADLTDRALAFRSVEDPSTWIPRSRYLSGNVRLKLRDAQTAATGDARYRANVSALTEVIPPRIEEGIHVRLGVTWVAPADYQQFIEDTFRVPPGKVTVNHVNGEWVIDAPTAYRGYTEDALDHGLVPQRWPGSQGGFNFVGTDDEQRFANQGVSLGAARSGVFDHWMMLASLMNSQPITINKSKEFKEASGGVDLHAGATRAAKHKADALQEAFATWAFDADADRRERLITEYNWRFNAVVSPVYDGSRRTFPGLGTTFDPYAYQRNAVERIVNEPTVLLDHVVGAGKTGTMIMGAMELRRLGLVRQPWIVVPNHIIDQVAREANQWYPAARVLSGAGRTSRDDRQHLLAQSAAQDWDMVIVPLSAFALMKTSPSTQAAFIRTHLTALESSLLEASGSDMSMKRLEKAISIADEKLRKVLSNPSKDDGLTFEQGGADYLFIDEAHLYKNLARHSGVQELSHQGSDLAMDMKLKLDYLRDRKRQEAAEQGIPGDAYVERVATFATGTPVANALAELWVMQTYLRPDLLAHAGVETIDAWGNTFTATTETVELNASGTKLRSVTRVGRFANVGDLVAMVNVFTDVVTRDQVPASLPTKRGGDNIVVSFEPSQDVKDFIQDLGYRSDNLNPSRMDLDNSLKIANDGRNASLDPRCAHMAAPADGGRARQIATNILTEWTATRDTVYLDSTGDPSPIPGGLQIVFCDRSVPTTDGRWNLYQGIKEELVAAGMDPTSIAFIHDYPKPDDKKALFERCNNGRVAVLIGSTEKMGTGTNVQTRAVALHHADAPWRPADLEQREGRVIRQGNQNQHVGIYNYVALGTFDTIMWQTLHRKAEFIHQLYSADRSLRSVEDVSADNLADSTALVKAIATGDQRYVRRVELEQNIEVLESQEATHSAEIRSRDSEIVALTRSIPRDQARLEALDAAAPGLAEWAGREQKSYEVTGRTFPVRKDASERLLAALRESYVGLKGAGAREFEHVATFAGIPLNVNRYMEHDLVMVHFGDIPLPALSVRPDQLWRTPSAGHAVLDTPDEARTKRAALASGLMTRMENALAKAPEHAAATRHQLDTDQTRLDTLRSTPDEPFPAAAALQLAKTELHGITDELAKFESSAEYVHAKEERNNRLALRGRTDGWSLMLNPTPALVEELGHTTADEVREMMRQREIAALETWTDLAADPQAVDDPAPSPDGRPSIESLLDMTSPTGWRHTPDQSGPELPSPPAEPSPGIDHGPEL